MFWFRKSTLAYFQTSFPRKLWQIQQYAASYSLSPGLLQGFPIYENALQVQIVNIPYEGTAAPMGLINTCSASSSLSNRLVREGSMS